MAGINTNLYITAHAKFRAWEIGQIPFEDTEREILARWKKAHVIDPPRRVIAYREDAGKSNEDTFYYKYRNWIFVVKPSGKDKFVLTTIINANRYKEWR